MSLGKGDICLDCTVISISERSVVQKKKAFSGSTNIYLYCLEALRALMGEMRVAGISFSLCEQISN